MRIAFYKFTVVLALLCTSKLTAQVLSYLDSSLSVDRRINDLIGRMTLDEKIGQMMQLDLSVAQTNPTLLASYGFGSVLSGGGSDPATGNSAESWANTYDMLQTYALKNRLKIPMIYGIDAMHGHSNVLGVTIFPHNIGLGCTQNPELVKEAARISAIEIAATGIDWTFAPCVAVPRNERWGRTYEGFGETPELAQAFGSAAVRGFQTESFSHPTSILACAKHFLGDGGTTDGIDQGNTELTEEMIRSIHLPGYKSAIDSGVGSIMISYSSINGLKMHGNKYWITDVLKNEMGFEGFVVSDWAGVDQVNSNYKKSVELSINAGIDMVMLPTRYNDFFKSMKDLIAEGKIDTARVDDAVRRILTIKFKLGLFERPFTDRSLLSLVGSTGHRAVARQCVRESMVLLKKKDGILPLKRTNVKILVAGSHADDIGNQCGGWTITWQGRSGDIIEGTTILEGMKKAAPGARIEFSRTGGFTNTTADYSVVVIGEKPYAEGRGDSKDLRIAKADVELIKKMKSYGAPVIVVLVSGRPLILEKILHDADAIFAAWLPGTEGDGVADVLFGDFLPKGKLSFTWPRSMVQIPINVGDQNYDPLFAYGYGITSYEASPIGSAPVSLSSIVTPDGKHVELTFNKKMKSPISPSNSFSISKNRKPLRFAQKSFLKNFDSTTIIIALDSVYFLRDDTVTVSYNGNDIHSYDGAALRPFAEMEAYNWVRPQMSIVPGKIEGENYQESYGTQVTADSGQHKGRFISNIDAGDWLEYSINVRVPNDYYLSLRVASDSIPGQVRISYGEDEVVKTLPITGDMQKWEATPSTKITLRPGKQSLVIKALTAGFNIDWISLVGLPLTDEDLYTTPTVAALVQDTAGTYASIKTIHCHIADPGFVSVKVYDIFGNEQRILVDEEKPIGVHTVSWDASLLSSGVYVYKFRSANSFIVQRFFVNN